MPKFAKGNNWKQNDNFFKNIFSPGNLLIMVILYQLTMFEAPSYNRIPRLKISFWPFKRGITPQSEMIRTKNTDQLYFDDESIFEISNL